MNDKKQVWNEYFKNTINDPPSPLLAQAIDYVIKQRRAIDIGGGALKDSRYLLSKGFETTTIDQSEETSNIAKTILSDKLHCHIASFVDYHFPVNTFDLASAMYALPFNLPQDFDNVFVNIKKSLVKGGIFAGNFFGPNDTWSNRPNMTFHTEKKVGDLFSDFSIILFEEKEFDGKTANGQPKHWHMFNVIARKN